MNFDIMLVEHGVCPAQQVATGPYERVTCGYIFALFIELSSRSRGCYRPLSMDFALAIIEALQGRETRDSVEQSLARN